MDLPKPIHDVNGIAEPRCVGIGICFISTCSLKLDFARKAFNLFLEEEEEETKGVLFVGNNTLIHFYAECGDLDYTRKVFDEMLERNTMSWTSLICGYGWRNMPKEAVSLFFEMVVARIKPSSVRLQLKEKAIQKVAGSSSIEVNGVIHEFTSRGDTDTHTEKSCIALMLQEINSRLRDAGHVPDLDNVLLDVDEKEKEYLLSGHSEEVAIDFGLIGKGKGVPIRVVKNLRMCSDYHSFGKPVSRIYDSEIIVPFLSQGLMI